VAIAVLAGPPASGPAAHTQAWQVGAGAS
jgi:hypothetical protein